MKNHNSRYPFPVSPNAKGLTPWRERRALRKVTHRALKETHGLLLEVAGPTEDGFVSLGRGKLPNGLLISNVDNSDHARFGSLKKENIDLFADARHLPFPAHSLGGIVTRGLVIVPDEVKTAFSGAIFDPATTEAKGQLMQLTMDDAEWENEQILKGNLRAALLREARRAIEPGGLYIAHMPMDIEVQAAQQLGFEQIAGPKFKQGSNIFAPREGDVIMRLTNMDTPAGQRIDHSAST